MSSSPNSSSSSDAKLPAFDGLADLRCPVTILLGTGTITVRECLALHRHTVLRLKQSAGEDLQVSINGISLARGEVTIVDTSTALRITELAPSRPQEVAL